MGEGLTSSILGNPVSFSPRLLRITASSAEVSKGRQSASSARVLCSFMKSNSERLGGQPAFQRCERVQRAQAAVAQFAQQRDVGGKKAQQAIGQLAHGKRGGQPL